MAQLDMMGRQNHCLLFCAVFLTLMANVSCTVCIDPIPIPILRATIGITLPIGGIRVINASYLLYHSSQEESGSTLTYELLVPPKRGLLFNQSEDDSNRTLSSFTQEDITSGHIAYRHTETPSAELSDYFTYRVCTSCNCTRETNFSISLYASSLIIINAGFSVTEGEKHTISDSELNAIAPPGYYVMFHVTSRGKPKWGQLDLEQSGVETVENTPIFNQSNLRSGSVKYVHNGLENSLRDSFEFTATAEVDSSDSNEPLLDLADRTFSGVVNITILPVNDHTPSVFTNKGSVEGVVRVVQGSTIQIDSSLLVFHDFDSDAVDDDLRYSLIFPLLPFGTLYLENNPGVRVRSWTEGDIRNGRLFYKAPAVSQPDLFHFSVSDGVHTSFYNTFHISVTGILLKFVAPIAFELQEGSSLVISQNYLQYAAANDDTLEDSDFVYLVTRLPSHGRLLFSGRDANTFTQEDLGSSNLLYQHDGSNTVADSFEFIISIPSRGASSYKIFDIKIAPIDDDPPEVAFIRDPMFVVELTHFTLDSHALRIVDLDSKTNRELSQIEVIVTRQPKHGFIARSSFGGPYVNTTTFSQYDVTNGFVRYQHTSLGHWNDSFVFRVTDGSGNVQQMPFQANITILPRVISLNVTSIAVIKGDEVVLEPQNLVVNHPYLHRAPGVIIIDEPPSRGKVINKNFGNQSVTRFATEDLANGSIVYQHSGDEHEVDQFVFHYENTQPVGYTRMSDQIIFPIEILVCIDPIPIPILRAAIGIALPIGGIRVINASHLLYHSSQEEPGSTLTYELLVPPKHGLLFNQSEDDSNRALSSFTQEDITSGHIAYHHTETPSAELSDYFTYRVCTSCNCTRETNFSISLYASSLIIINTGFSVTEGEKHTISDSELNAIAPPGYYVTFYVTSRGKPKRGQLDLEQSGVETVENTPIFNQSNLRSDSVKYVHNGLENSLRDSFEFTATAEVDSSDSDEPLLHLTDLTFSGVVNITIIPVNDHTPSVFINKGSVEGVVLVVQGSTIQINSSLLVFHDFDSDAVDDDLRYSLIFPLLPFGTLYLENNPGVRVSSWTEGDIRNGQLFYKAPAVTQPDLFHFSVSDGVHTSFYNTFHITVTSILFKFVAPIAFELQEGSSLVISQNYLQYAAANDDTLEDSDFVYLVTRLPSHGRLLFSGRDANTFTQEDLGSSNVLYQHDGSNTVADSFEFIISIPSRGASSYKIFDIKIAPIDDDPPEVAFIRDPIFVVELTHFTLDSHALRIVDLDSETNRELSQIEVIVTRQPKHGFIARSGFGGPYVNTTTFSQYDVTNGFVRYQHTSLGHWNDSFVFWVTDGSGNIQQMPFQANITILPRVISLNVTSIAVIEGDEVVLEPQNLVVDHPYLHRAPGMIIIDEPPSRGKVINKNFGNQSVSRFTTEDLANGSIVYQHSGDEHEVDQFVFHYENTQPVGYARMSDQIIFPIEILESAQIASEVKDVTVTIGEVANFTCDATGADVILSWEINGETYTDCSNPGFCVAVTSGRDSFIVSGTFSVDTASTSLGSTNQVQCIASQIDKMKKMASSKANLFIACPLEYTTVVNSTAGGYITCLSCQPPSSRRLSHSDESCTCGLEHYPVIRNETLQACRPCPPGSSRLDFNDIQCTTQSAASRGQRLVTTMMATAIPSVMVVIFFILSLPAVYLM